MRQKNNNYYKIIKKMVVKQSRSGVEAEADNIQVNKNVFKLRAFHSPKLNRSYEF